MTNEEAIRLVDDRMCYGRGKWSKHHQPVIDEYWQAGEMAIKALEAEPHWIPVTERLPKKSGRYYVTEQAYNVDDRKHEGVCWTTTDMADYSAKEKRWIRARFLKVVAWMEREPYKG
jgi:hypothetical protein